MLTGPTAGTLCCIRITCVAALGEEDPAEAGCWACIGGSVIIEGVGAVLLELACIALCFDFLRNMVCFAN